jgi:hypothetical protein
MNTTRMAVEDDPILAQLIDSGALHVVPLVGET